MASENVLTLDGDSFREQIQNEQPILVDFWAAWCMPCRMVAPVIEELAGEMQGKVRFGKVDIDSHQEIANEFGIQGVPTFILFANGEAQGRLVGNVPKQAFEDFLGQHVN